MINTSALNKIHEKYNGDHDLGPDAPIHWSVEELAHLVGKLVDHIEKMEEKFKKISIYIDQDEVYNGLKNQITVKLLIDGAVISEDSVIV